MDFIAFAIWWGGIFGARYVGLDWFNCILWPYCFGYWLAATTLKGWDQ